MNVPVGPGTLGRVTDALGQPIDGAGPLINVRSSLVEVKAPGIVARQSVREPLFTGGCHCCAALCCVTLAGTLLSPLCVRGGSSGTVAGCVVDSWWMVASPVACPADMCLGPTC